MNQKNPQKLSEDFVGLKNTYEDSPKKASKLVYVFAVAFLLVMGLFMSSQTYHTVKNTEYIKAINNNIEDIHLILNEWELTE